MCLLLQVQTEHERCALGINQLEQKKRERTRVGAAGYMACPAGCGRGPQYGIYAVRAVGALYDTPPTRPVGPTGQVGAPVPP